MAKAQGQSWQTRALVFRFVNVERLWISDSTSLGYNCLILKIVIMIFVFLVFLNNTCKLGNSIQISKISI